MFTKHSISADYVHLLKDGGEYIKKLPASVKRLVSIDNQLNSKIWISKVGSYRQKLTNLN